MICGIGGGIIIHVLQQWTLVAAFISAVNFSYFHKLWSVRGDFALKLNVPVINHQII